MAAASALGMLLNSSAIDCLDAEVPNVSDATVSRRVRTGPMSVGEAAAFASERLRVKVRPPCPSFEDGLVVHDLTLQAARDSELPDAAVWSFAHRSPDPELGDIPPTFAQLVVYAGVAEIEGQGLEPFELGAGEAAAFQAYEFRDVPLVAGPGDREVRTFVIHSDEVTATLFVSSPAGDLPSESALHSFLRVASRD